MRCAVYDMSETDKDDWAPQFVRWQDCPGRHEHDGATYGCINGQAAEPLGSVWRCSECGKYWTVYLPLNHPAARVVTCYVPVWRPSRWRERWRAKLANERPTIL
jgi:hypothetical protein